MSVQVRQSFGQYGPRQEFHLVKTFQAFNASHGMVDCEVESISCWRTAAEALAAYKSGDVDWEDD